MMFKSACHRHALFPSPGESAWCPKRLRGMAAGSSDNRDRPEERAVVGRGSGRVYADPTKHRGEIRSVAWLANWCVQLLIAPLRRSLWSPTCVSLFARDRQEGKRMHWEIRDHFPPLNDISRATVRAYWKEADRIALAILSRLHDDPQHQKQSACAPRPDGDPFVWCKG